MFVCSKNWHNDFLLHNDYSQVWKSQASFKTRQNSDRLGCTYFPSFKLDSYSFHKDNECHAEFFNSATSVLPCFLDITFIVFHSRSLQSRSWILLHDKCHRWKNGPVPKSLPQLWPISVNNASHRSHFSLDKGTIETACSNLETFCPIFIWICQLCIGW